MKEKRFIVSLTWQEVNGGEQGRIKGRIVARTTCRRPSGTFRKTKTGTNR